MDTKAARELQPGDLVGSAEGEPWYTVLGAEKAAMAMIVVVRFPDGGSSTRIFDDASTEVHVFPAAPGELTTACAQGLHRMCDGTGNRGPTVDGERFACQCHCHERKTT